jgi:hypothetical protein
MMERESRQAFENFSTGAGALCRVKEVLPNKSTPDPLCGKQPRETSMLFDKA